MSLPQRDRDFLADAQITYREFTDGMINIELTRFPLPPGYQVSEANVLLRLAPAYPDAPPDMWWIEPHLTRVDGRAIPATELTETHDGRAWQRWSRHLDGNSWRPGIDGLESYIRVLRTDLVSAAA